MSLANVDVPSMPSQNRVLEPKVETVGIEPTQQSQLIPVNGILVEDGHAAFQVPEDMVDGQWRLCSAWRLNRTEDGGIELQFADEDDLEQITSPEVPS